MQMTAVTRNIGIYSDPSHAIYSERVRILTINFPAFTSNPPQLHHQKTKSNHSFSPKPPAKTRSHHPQKLLQKRPSLEKAASPNSLILWGFLRVLRETKADRNYAWTYWRWVQS
jgi:hypothetical protein